MAHKFTTAEKEQRTKNKKQTQKYNTCTVNESCI